MFDGARERAIFLDEYLEREKKTIGPLHGLPVSIKVSRNLTAQDRE
jgi:amidase